MDAVHAPRIPGDQSVAVFLLVASGATGLAGGLPSWVVVPAISTLLRIRDERLPAGGALARTVTWDRASFTRRPGGPRWVNTGR